MQQSITNCFTFSFFQKHLKRKDLQGFAKNELNIAFVITIGKKYPKLWYFSYTRIVILNKFWNHWIEQKENIPEWQKKKKRCKKQDFGESCKAKVSLFKYFQKALKDNKYLASMTRNLPMKTKPQEWDQHCHPSQAAIRLNKKNKK